MSDPIRIKILTRNGEPLRDTLGNWRGAFVNERIEKGNAAVEMVEAAPMRERIKKLEKALHEIVAETDSEDAYNIIDNMVEIAEEALKP